MLHERLSRLSRLSALLIFSCMSFSFLFSMRHKAESLTTVSNENKINENKIYDQYYFSKLLALFDQGVVSLRESGDVKTALKKLFHCHKDFRYVINNLSRSVFELSELRKYGASFAAISRAERNIQKDIDKLLYYQNKLVCLSSTKKEVDYLVKVLGDANKSHRFRATCFRAPLYPVHPYAKRYGGIYRPQKVFKKKRSSKGLILKSLLLLGVVAGTGILVKKLYDKIKRSIPTVDDFSKLPEDKIEMFVEKFIEGLIKKKVLKVDGKKGLNSEAIIKILETLLKRVPAEKVEAACAGAMRGLGRLGCSKEKIKSFIKEAKNLSGSVKKLKSYIDTAQNIKKSVTQNPLTTTVVGGIKKVNDATSTVIVGVSSMKDKIVSKTKHGLGYVVGGVTNGLGHLGHRVGGSVVGVKNLLSRKISGSMNKKAEEKKV